MPPLRGLGGVGNWHAGGFLPRGGLVPGYPIAQPVARGKAPSPTPAAAPSLARCTNHL
jgi:hypothetical protein